MGYYVASSQRGERIGNLCGLEAEAATAWDTVASKLHTRYNSGLSSFQRPGTTRVRDLKRPDTARARDFQQPSTARVRDIQRRSTTRVRDL